MKEVVVLSGKGGTGKTSIVGCFAALAQSKVLADCDVDAADLHPLLKTVIQQARLLAKEPGFGYIISDGPPGIGCPVISFLSGANLALLVTEPTLSGIHDLEQVLGVCHHFGVPALVCINVYK